jgi:pimeloyl-ACP methyl ester carboxylesterase
MENISVDFPFTDFGGNGPTLSFLHANGYPAECYLPLINRLKNISHLFAMNMRPLWPNSKPEELIDWMPLSDDFREHLEVKNDAVIGVGHSLGAVVTLRTALQTPELFKALVLLDPVLFPPWFIQGWKLIKQLGLGYTVHPLIPTARSRRRNFSDIETIYSSYREKKVFRYIADDNLRTMIDGMVQPASGGGYELRYSPEWEIQIYYTGVSDDEDIWANLPSLKIPVLIIRGRETNTFFPVTVTRVKKARPETEVVTVDHSTHLVPLEKPDIVGDIIHNFMERVL